MGKDTAARLRTCLEAEDRQAVNSSFVLASDPVSSSKSLSNSSASGEGAASEEQQRVSAPYIAGGLGIRPYRASLVFPPRPPKVPLNDRCLPAEGGDLLAMATKI
jgi:hypothetical protein